MRRGLNGTNIPKKNLVNCCFALILREERSQTMAEHLGVRVRDCISPLKSDIDVSATVDALRIDAVVNRCINAVTESLKRPTPKFTERQREHLEHIFLWMRHAHRGVRELLRSDGSDPLSVSVMPLVRSQLEILFAICLVIEKPESLALYLKDGWKKLYIRHLCMREECAALPRVAIELQRVVPSREQFRLLSGVTEAEKQTIDEEELGVSLPRGVSRSQIKQFPTPRDVIRQVLDPERKAMLRRLYPEYQFLCGFVHFSPAATVLSSLLDPRHRYAAMSSSGQKYDVFQKELAGPALWYDSISVAQSCSEFMSIYPDDVELARTALEGWKVLIEQSLIGRVIWQLRARRLLGVLS